jgi:polysaccharide biosynthesis/export protein
MQLRKAVSLLVVSLTLPYALSLSAQTGAPSAQTGAPSAQTAAPSPTPGGRAAAEGQAAMPTDYRIGPEDKLQIAVWNNEAMSRTVPVRPDGKISLPLLNDVQAAGLSPMQLRDALVKRLADYMPTAEVSVIVLETKSPKVSVIGEVSRPARYELTSRTTVLDVLAMSGGLTQFAGRGRIFVLRRADEELKRVPFNYNRAVSAEGEQVNFALEPGDIVVVP